MTQPSSERSLSLSTFGSGINAAVVGAAGGIGQALVSELRQSPSVASVLQLSRSPLPGHRNDEAWFAIDIEAESTIAQAAMAIKDTVGPLHLVIMTTGLLHDGATVRPERTWQSISPEAMERLFRINATGPALVGKHFLPLLPRAGKSVFAALSARVGSIADNELGGWHAYRASKAALNMLLKTFSIELSRRNPHAICVGLHPGTVDTPLSKPFQRSIPQETLISPRQSARYLLDVLDRLTPADSGQHFAWDGTRIEP